MIVATTGTKLGGTPAQHEALYQTLLRLNGPDYFSVAHGCCVGWDEEFHNNVRAWFPRSPIYGHPSNIPGKVARLDFREDWDTLYQPLPPLVRNCLIVDGEWMVRDPADVLIAAPKGFSEEVRSGTWATVRLARKTRRPDGVTGILICIIWPDGRVKEEQPTSISI